MDSSKASLLMLLESAVNEGVLDLDDVQALCTRMQILKLKKEALARPSALALMSNLCPLATTFTPQQSAPQPIQLNRTSQGCTYPCTPFNTPTYARKPADGWRDEPSDTPDGTESDDLQLTQTPLVNLPITPNMSDPPKSSPNFMKISVDTGIDNTAEDKKEAAPVPICSPRFARIPRRPNSTRNWIPPSPKTDSTLSKSASCGPTAPVTPSRFYQGIIKSYSDEDGYGFIECPELRAIHGHDVFLHKNQIEEAKTPLSKLMPVFFTIKMSKQGKPQAREVQARF